MAILVKFTAPGTTVEDYERVNATMGVTSDADAPDGLIQHLAAEADDGIVVIDVWESEEKLNRFFEERAGRALAEHGIQTSGPEVYTVHAMIPRGKGTQPNVVMEVHIDQGSDLYDDMVSRMPTHQGDGSGHPVYSHVAGIAADGGMYIVDLWESPEAFGRFAEEEIVPAAAGRLGEIEPSFTPVHNVIHGKAAVPA